MARFVSPITNIKPNGFLKFFNSNTNADLITFKNDIETIQNELNVPVDASGNLPNIFFSGLAKVKYFDEFSVQYAERDPVGGENQLGEFAPWDPLVTYDRGDFVEGSDGKFYQSINSGNSGNDPTLSAANWQEIPINPIYNLNVSYSLGDVVQTTDGNLWKSLVGSNLNNDPSTDNGANWFRAVDNVKETTLNLINIITISNSVPVGFIIELSGFTTAGDGGGAQWKLTSLTGQTASQSPSQLGGPLLNDVNGNQWEYVPIAGTVAREINADAIGMVGGGVIDNTLAFTASIQTGVTTRFGAKNYKVTNLIADKPGVTIRGSSTPGSVGQRGTTFSSDATTGAVLRLKQRFCTVEGIFIDSIGARLSSSDVTGFGIHVEADDVAGERAFFTTLTSVEIRNQPSHGVLLIAGSAWFSKLTHVWSLQNTGHGIVYDYGSIVSRVNTEAVGISHLDMCAAQENVGHGLVVGNLDTIANRGIRITGTNCDFTANAESAGIRRSNHQTWVFATASSFTNCVWGGPDVARTVANTNGGFFAGNSTTVESSRILDVIGNAFEIAEVASSTTTGININEFNVDGSLQGQLNPAVQIGTGIKGCSVNSSDTTFIDKLTNFGGQTGNFRKVEIINKLASDTRAANTTNTADSELKFSMRKLEKVQFKAVIFYSSNAAADIKMTFLFPAAATLRWAPSSGLIVNTAGTIVEQISKVDSSSVILGTLDTNVRCIEFVGEVETTGTAGDFSFAFSQNASDAFATAVTSRSHMVVMRL